MNRVSIRTRANTGAEGAGTECNAVETRFIASPHANGIEWKRVSTNGTARYEDL